MRKQFIYWGKNDVRAKTSANARPAPILDRHHLVGSVTKINASHFGIRRFDFFLTPTVLHSQCLSVFFIVGNLQEGAGESRGTAPPP